MCELAVVVRLCVLAAVRIGIGFNWRTCCRVVLFDGGEVFYGGEVYLLTRVCRDVRFLVPVQVL